MQKSLFQFKIDPMFGENSSLTADAQKISKILNVQTQVFPSFGIITKKLPDEFFYTTFPYRVIATTNYIK